MYLHWKNWVNHCAFVQKKQLNIVRLIDSSWCVKFSRNCIKYILSVARFRQREHTAD